MGFRLACLAAASAALLAAARPASALTDEEVRRAIEKGKEFLIGLQADDGSFQSTARLTNQQGVVVAGADRMTPAYSTLIFMTLAYMGEHPNRPVMSKALDYVLSLDPDEAYVHNVGYALPIRIMGLCYVHDKLALDRRRAVRDQIMKDMDRLLKGQRPEGGWRYFCNPEKDHDIDYSITQWGVLAIREATRVGIEPSRLHLARCMGLYERGQQEDGGWGYQPPIYQGRRIALLRPAPYLSMTAAGLASMYILSDELEPGAGCPCAPGRSRRAVNEANRRIDAALGWMVNHFENKEEAPKDARFTQFGWRMYALYSVERVGIAAGYKHFGKYDWYKRGAEEIVKSQQEAGNWRTVVDTCFALLFLYKGRAPVLFNKLEFDGDWNLHRRDIANLTSYVERVKEQQFHWQIVSLEAPTEDLHEAPILYITSESAPQWDAKQKRKLRAFTDDGGSVLLEASCGNRAARTWVEGLVADVWPEWPLKKLPEGHATFTAPYPIEPKRPEILGVDDGIRTVVFYAPDDVSCAWHMRAMATKEYLFRWGINLYTYATDGAPLRAKLAGRGGGDEDEGLLDVVMDPGPKQDLKIARVRYGGNWEVGANYGGFAVLAKTLEKKAGVTLSVTEERRAPIRRGGVAPADLAGYDAAFLTGSEAFELSEAEAKALRAYVDAGGFLWIESATGSPAFHTSLMKAVEPTGLRIEFLPRDHPILTGRIEGADGYDLTRDIQFRRSLRVIRAARPYAELMGVWDGQKLVGVYSPFDVVFSLAGYEANDLKGYEAASAMKVASNIVMYLTAR